MQKLTLLNTYLYGCAHLEGWFDLCIPGRVGVISTWSGDLATGSKCQGREFPNCDPNSHLFFTSDMSLTIQTHWQCWNHQPALFYCLDLLPQRCIKSTVWNKSSLPGWENKRCSTDWGLSSPTAPPQLGPTEGALTKNNSTKGHAVTHGNLQQQSTPFLIFWHTNFVHPNVVKSS